MSSVMLPERHPAVVAQEVDGRVVLLHTERQEYFGLNEIGSRIWSALGSGDRSLEGLCESICAAYPEARVQQVRADVEELLKRLRSEDLVRDST